jgi:hypothetical protein
VDSLNEMIDMQTVRVSGLNNRVPPAVLWLEVAGAALALGLLAAYLAILGRDAITVVLGAALVTLLLLVTFDLDRPTRGVISHPFDTPHGPASLDGATAGRSRAAARPNRMMRVPLQSAASRRRRSRRS